MKTYTATQLNKSAQEVFAAVNEDGAVEIKHDRYPGKVFVIQKRTTTERVDYCNECGKEQLATESGVSTCCKSFMVTTNRDGYEDQQWERQGNPDGLKVGDKVKPKTGHDWSHFRKSDVFTIERITDGMAWITEANAPYILTEIELVENKK